MLFRTTEGLRNPTDFSFLLCLEGGVAESWGMTGVLGGTSWEFFTKGWVRHLGAGLTLICCPGRSMSKALAGTGGSSTCLLPTSYSVKLSTVSHRGARQKAGKSAESTAEMRRNIAEGTSELDTPGFKTLGK